MPSVEKVKIEHYRALQILCLLSDASDGGDVSVHQGTSFPTLQGARAFQKKFLKYLKSLELIDAPIVPGLYQELREWADYMIRSGDDRSSLSKKDLLCKIREVIHEIDEGMLCDYAQYNPPSEGDMRRSVMIERRVYMLQLELIGTLFPQKMRAARDFSNAMVNRAKWIEQELVGLNQIKDYEQILQETFEDQSGIFHRRSTGTLEENGRELLQRCLEQCADEKIGGHPLPKGVTAGEFHSLADQMKIGWRADWKTAISQQLLHEPSVQPQENVAAPLVEGA